MIIKEQYHDNWAAHHLFYLLDNIPGKDSNRRIATGYDAQRQYVRWVNLMGIMAGEDYLMK